jgi:hypothetical protein
LISGYGASLVDQMPQSRRDLECVRDTRHASHRRIEGAIVAADDQTDIIAVRVVDVAANVVIRPGQVELEIEVADSIVPPGVVLGRAGDLLHLRLDGATGRARRLLLSVTALARRAVGDEYDDGEHRCGDQGRDWKCHLPTKATFGGLERGASSSDQGALSANVRCPFS